ncbi:MAG: DUF5309 domain-containing protein, partial [Muribaculaceae bacterium]|nr:DUF5309 domain-containing protein [Muribaculaceae bacterium]
TDVVNQAAPELLRSEIDSRIVKIRPMATPIDQISRHANCRRAGSMVVEYYAVDSKPFVATLRADIVGKTETDLNKKVKMALSVEDTKMFAVSETVLLANVVNSAGRPVTGYISEKTETMLKGYFTCTDKNGFSSIPEISKGTKIVRMGRAAGELDIQTEQFQALPRKDSNFCQIFKTQIEQSTLVTLSNKEVGWTLSDQEEAAIIDMRQCMERNFMFGNKLRLDFDDEDTVMLTGGIWNQAGKEMSYMMGELTDEKMVSICREAFTGSNGSSRKLLIGGSGFIEAMHGLGAARTLSAADKMTRWGLDFTTYVSKFGTLYVLLSETFDQCGHANDAMIIDPEYLTKYSHIPFKTEKLNLRAGGVRNTDAIVITEASCLVLRYPDAHMRIIASE